MGDWNKREQQYNRYENNGIDPSSREYEEADAGQNYHNGNRKQANNPRTDLKKDDQHLARIVQQNETIISLLKGIKSALNQNNRMQGGQNRIPKDSVKPTGGQSKKHYVHRFDKEQALTERPAYKKKNRQPEKHLSDNSNVEVVDEAMVKGLSSVEKNLLNVDLINENEIGEENPFAMFDFGTKKE